MEELAINGGVAIRQTMLPYGRQAVDESDIDLVVQVLDSDWLTTGPKVPEFEEAFADFVGAKEAVAVSNGTAALHAAMYALGIGPGDEVIVPPMTFVATANCVVYQGGTPVFADVDPCTLLLDPVQVESKLTSRTRAIITVDYGGQPCDYDALQSLADRHGLALAADACHALGGSYKGRSVGSLAELSTFSFHPVKHITTGEGGMISTNDSVLARRMRIFRNHGITTEHQQRSDQGTWFYEMMDLGYNYRITDFQCALGLAQLRKLHDWLRRRREIARRYDAAFTEISAVEPVHVRDDVSHAYHLYMIRIGSVQPEVGRAEIFAALRAEGIGVNVHYIPVHLHPFYRRRFGTGPGLCPVSEAAYEQLISVPMFPQMSNRDVDDVITAVSRVFDVYRC
jgi:perosamine synthetase